MLFMCSGFFIPVSEMNWAIRWVAYLSPMRYAFRMFMRNEFDSIPVTDSALTPTGDSVLEFFDMNSGLVVSYWGDLGIILAFGLSYAICVDLFIRFLR